MPQRRGIGMFAALAMLASGAVVTMPASAADSSQAKSQSQAAAAKVPNVGKLAGSLAKQKLDWTPCKSYSQNPAGEVMCATVKVPKDWHNVDTSKTWDVSISYLENRDPDDSRFKGTIFANPGGPGGTGLPYPAIFDKSLPDLAPYYNYLGFEPRGIKSTNPLGSATSDAECKYSYEKSPDPWVRLKAYGEQCSADADIKTINTEQVAYDMDFIRHLMKLDKVDYIGYSYGTWLGAWYSKVFGSKYGGKFILDSSVDATQSSLQHAWIWEQPTAIERQARMQSSLWVKRLLSQSPGEEATAARAAQDPKVTSELASAGAGSFGAEARGEVAQKLLTLKAKQKPAVVREMLAREQLSSADGQYATVLKAEIKALEKLQGLGGASAKSADESATEETLEGTDRAYFSQIRCNDGQWRQGKNFYESSFAKLAPAVQDGESAKKECAYWRSDVVMPEITDPESYPETIVLQSELDRATGWTIGRVSGMELPNTSFIAVDNESKHGVFPYGTEEVDGPVLDFLLDGKRPKNITVAQALPMSGEETTYEAWTPLDEKARHHGAPNTDPWKVGTGEVTPAPVKMTGAEMLAPTTEATQFQAWVSNTYGLAGQEALLR